MLSEDVRLPLVDDGRDGKRKLEDYGGLYSMDHGPARAPIPEPPGTYNYMLVCIIYPQFRYLLQIIHLETTNIISYNYQKQ